MFNNEDPVKTEQIITAPGEKCILQTHQCKQKTWPPEKILLSSYSTVKCMKIPIFLLTLLENALCHTWQLKCIQFIKCGYKSHLLYDTFKLLRQKDIITMSSLVEQAFPCLVLSCTWYWIKFIVVSMRRSLALQYLDPHGVIHRQQLNICSFTYTHFGNFHPHSIWRMPLINEGSQAKRIEC